MHWLTTTHARRWQLAKGLDGYGAVYQGRFKGIPVEADRSFLWVCRYVERNALRAGLVGRAEEWRWCSLHIRWTSPDLSDWPVLRPSDWIEQVNRAQTPAEIEAFRRMMREGKPFGSDEWREALAVRWGQKPARHAGRQRRSHCPQQMTPDPLTRM